MFTIKELSKKIATITKQSKAVIDLLDEAMPSILYHAMKDGQITPAIDLVGKIAAKHRPAVVEYLCEFGPFSYTKEKGFTYNKVKAKDYPDVQGSDTRETWVLFTIGDMPLFSAFNGKADTIPETKAFDFDAKLIELLHRAKLAQAGQSTKFNGLAESKFLQMIRNNLPGEVLTKIDTVKDNGKTVDLVPAVNEEAVIKAA